MLYTNEQVRTLYNAYMAFSVLYKTTLCSDNLKTQNILNPTTCVCTPGSTFIIVISILTVNLTNCKMWTCRHHWSANDWKVIKQQHTHSLVWHGFLHNRVSNIVS